MTASTENAASPAAGASVRPDFDPLTILLHWLVVVLVVAQFATALAIDQAPPALAGALLQVHRSTGAALWGVVVIRLGWRFTGMRAPPLPPGMGRWLVVCVRLSEYGLYALLLLQPVTGMADTLWRGRPFALFGQQVPRLLAKNHALAAEAHALHVWGAWLLATTIGLHAGAALFHHLVLKDSTLESMLPWARRRRHA